MVQKIKLVISEKGKDIDTVMEETDTDLSLLYKSLEKFRFLANAAITKLIVESEQCIEEEESSSDNDEEVCLNPKRKKKKL